MGARSIQMEISLWTAVPWGALTVYCLFFFIRIHHKHCACILYSTSKSYTFLCSCCSNLKSWSCLSVLQLSMMAMLMLSLFLATLWFPTELMCLGKVNIDEASFFIFWTLSCSGICFIFSSNEAHFVHEVTENSGWLLPDKRHVFVWHWVGGLHHLAVRLMAMRSSVPTQRQRAKTIIRGN